jgi:hypothetical protein
MPRNTRFKLRSPSSLAWLNKPRRKDDFARRKRLTRVRGWTGLEELRHLAVQRKISGAFSTDAADQYLCLLAIAQTCRFQEKSFLGFLLSGLNNVDAFAESRRGHRTKTSVFPPSPSPLRSS